jgi:hypothetical protein
MARRAVEFAGPFHARREVFTATRVTLAAFDTPSRSG